MLIKIFRSQIRKRPFLFLLSLIYLHFYKNPVFNNSKFWHSLKIPKLCGYILHASVYTWIVLLNTIFAYFPTIFPMKSIYWIDQKEGNTYLRISFKDNSSKSPVKLPYPLNKCILHKYEKCIDALLLKISSKLSSHLFHQTVHHHPFFETAVRNHNFTIFWQ